MARKYPTTQMCSGELLERFEPTVRDTDVFTATIAKCGQTWLTATLHHLRTRADDEDYGEHGLMGVVPWLEIPWDPLTREPYDLDARLEWLAGLPDPRVFKMHVVWDEVPRPPDSRAKVITITRDPRDVPWSMYQHLLRLSFQPLGPNPPPFEAWFPSWLERGYYAEFIENTWPHRDDPDLLWLRYEDMKAAPAPEVRRIADFLGWERTDAEIDRVVELTSFDRMRQAEASGSIGMNHGFTKPFFRQGAVGKNREHLSPQMEQQIVDLLRSRFDAECCDFLFAQG